MALKSWYGGRFPFMMIDTIEIVLHHTPLWTIQETRITKPFHQTIRGPQNFHRRTLKLCIQRNSLRTERDCLLARLVPIKSTSLIMLIIW
jgi:tetrahydromethanopterin S-methyltransferase subunit C